MRFAHPWLVVLCLAFVAGCAQDAGDSAAPTSDSPDGRSGGGGKADGAAEGCPGFTGSVPWVSAERHGRTVIVPDFPATGLGNTRRVTVYLPAAYDYEPERRFPVLYMHDGQNLFDAGRASFGAEWRVDETVDWLTEQGHIEPIIVVGVDNTWARMAEYTPSVDPDIGEGGQAAQYADFVAHEVKPWVDAKLRTQCQREQTGLVGSSLGGLVSLFILQRHPGIFARVGCVSSSFWWNGGEAFEWSEAVLRQWRPGSRLWLDAGTAEGNDSGTEEGANLDPDGDGVGYMVGDARAMRDSLLAGGLQFGDELGFFEHEGADHSEGAWAARLHLILAFLWGARPMPSFGAVRLWSYGDRIPVGQRVSLAVETGATRGPNMTLPPSWVHFSSSDSAVAAVDAAGLVHGVGPGVATLTATVGEVQDSIDLVVEAPFTSTVTLAFRVEVPASTPAGSTVWLAGGGPALGEWSPAGFALRPGADGRWVGDLTVQRGAGFAYKVTRGSWETVEKDAWGAEVPDRHAAADASGVVEVRVERWADAN